MTNHSQILLMLRMLMVLLVLMMLAVVVEVVEVRRCWMSSSVYDSLH